MKVWKIGDLRASDISGDACEDCWRNISHFPCAMLKGEDEEMREAARFLYKECEIVPAGTKARIAELEAENKRLRKALERVLKLLDRPMLNGEMPLYINHAIRVVRKAVEVEK